MRETYDYANTLPTSVSTICEGSPNPEGTKEFKAVTREIENTLDYLKKVLHKEGDLSLSEEDVDDAYVFLGIKGIPLLWNQ